MLKGRRMAAVKVIVNEPLAGMLGIEGGEIIVRVSGKITILQALKCAGIDLHRPEIQGCFMIICNNEIRTGRLPGAKRLCWARRRD